VYLALRDYSAHQLRCAKSRRRKGLATVGFSFAGLTPVTRGFYWWVPHSSCVHPCSGSPLSC